MAFMIVNGYLHQTGCKQLDFICNRFGVLRDSQNYFTNVKSVLVYNPKANCKCVKQYKEMFSLNALNIKYADFINNVCECAVQAGLSVAETMQGDLNIRTEHESWVVCKKEVTHEDPMVTVTLLHKNAINFHIVQKCGTTPYPDYHIQWTDTVTAEDIIAYIVNHEQYRYPKRA